MAGADAYRTDRRWATSGGWPGTRELPIPSSWSPRPARSTGLPITAPPLPARPVTERISAAADHLRPVPLRVAGVAFSPQRGRFPLNPREENEASGTDPGGSRRVWESALRSQRCNQRDSP